MNEDLLKKVKRIEITTRKSMNDLMSGGYKSHFKGQGVQFSEHRTYTPGDDVRHIDWKVSARSREPLIKQYEEERELSVFIIADLSSSLSFGSRGQTKKDIVTELGSMLAYAASNTGDKVGVLIVTNRVQKIIPLKKGRNHVLRIMRDLLSAETQPGGTALGAAIEEAQRLLKHNGIVFILSDFQTQGYETNLKRLSRKHDVVAIHVSDPLESLSQSEAQSMGTLEIMDPESGRISTLNPSQFVFQRNYSDNEKSFSEHLKKTFNQGRIETLTISTHDDHAEKLTQFLKKRKSRR